jgi:hypothetical protein
MDANGELTAKFMPLGDRLYLFERLPIDLVQLIARQVGVQAGGADVAVAGQRLGYFQIA